MEELLVYLLKSGLCIIVFFGIYRIFLKNETFYRFNRYFLLSGIIISVLLPYAQYTYKVIVPVPAQLTGTADKTAVVPTGNSMEFWLYTGLLIYASVAGFLVFRHLFGLMKIRKIISQQGYTILQGYKVVSSSVFKHSFSVFNYIFFDHTAEVSEVEKKLILEHEQAHIIQYHWIDLLITQFICALQWFNPFIWMYMKSIKQNHEYLADQAVLQKGNSPAVYKAALINHSLKVPVFMFASSFAQYDKLERVRMMMKTSSRPLKKLGVLLVIPFFAIFLMAFAKPVYTIVYAADLTEAKNTEKFKAAENKALNKNDLNKNEGNETKEVIVRSADQKIKNTTDTITGKSVSAQDSDRKKTVQTAAADTVRHKKTQMGFLSSGYSEGINEPLYILDGVEIDDRTFQQIKPGEIKEINVLKDHSAIDKYGIRAKNGVIIVFSKSVEPKADLKK